MTRARRWGAELAREAPADGPTSWCRWPDSGVPRRARLCPRQLRSAVRARHHPQSYVRTDVHPTTQSDPRERRAPEAQCQSRRGVAGKADRLDRRFVVARARRSVKIVRMMPRTRARREVHFRISSPPIKHPDFLRYRYTRARQACLAARMGASKRCRAYVDADSLAFLSVDGHLSRDGLTQRRDNVAARNSPTIVSPGITRPR